MQSIITPFLYLSHSAKKIARYLNTVLWIKYHGFFLFFCCIFRYNQTVIKFKYHDVTNYSAANAAPVILKHHIIKVYHKEMERLWTWKNYLDIIWNLLLLFPCLLTISLLFFKLPSLKVSTLFYGQPADFPSHSFVFCLLKASFTQGIKKDISIDCLFLLFYLNCLMIWHSDICPLTDLIFSHSYSIHFLSFQQPSNSKMYYLLCF